MSAEIALLEAVCSAPDDDGPRLRFADWLEETGQPANAARAEFIRLQCALARLEEFDPQRPELERRANALLARHGEEWARPLVAAALGKPSGLRGWLSGLLGRDTPPITGWEYRRGFVEWVSLDASAFPGRAEALARLTPLRHLRVTGLGDFDRREPAEMRRLLSWSGLGRLLSIDLSGNYLGGVGASRLAEAPALAGITHLVLDDCSIGDQGVTALACSPYLGSLTALHLGQYEYDRRSRPVGNAFNPGSLRVLLASPHLRRLTFLDLSGAYLDAVGANIVAEAECLAGVDGLNLRDTALGPEAATALAASGVLRQLRRLDLSANGLTDAGAIALAGSPVLEGVTHLDLSLTALTDAGVRALAGSPHLTQLQALVLSENPIGDEGAAALAESPHLPNLREISIDGWRLSWLGKDRLRERFFKGVDFDELS